MNNDNDRSLKKTGRAKRSFLPRYAGVACILALYAAGSRGADPIDRLADSAAAEAPIVDTIPVAPVEAAPAPEPEKRTAAVGIGIEEIIVTAQRREEKANEVPIAISAFSGEALTALGVTDTRDLARLVPGFSAAESGGNTTIYTLRGVGFNDATYTATGTVGTYVDEVNLPFSIMTRGANLDVKRVEILKGPQGTLYGRNTTGGLINYIPNAPGSTFEAGTNTSYGRFNTLDTENYVSGPLTDNLNGRFALRYIHAADGYQESQTREGDTLGRQDKLSGRALLDWNAADDLSVRFMATGWYDKGEPQAPQVVGFICQNPFTGCAQLPAEFQPPQFNPYPHEGDDPQAAEWPDFPWKLNDSFYSASVKPIWNLSDTMTLTTIASALRVRTDGSGAISGLQFFNADSPALNAQIDTIALESRLSDAWWDQRFRWSVGFNVSRDKGDEAHHLRIEGTTSLFPTPGYFSLPPALQAITPPTALGTFFTVAGTTLIKQTAVFLNTDTTLTDTLGLNVGLRYTENKNHATGCSSNDADDPVALVFASFATALSAAAAAEFSANPATLAQGRPSLIGPGDCFAIKDNGSNEEFSSDLNQNNLAGRVALTWKPDDATLYYASVSRGYKAGGFPVLNATRQRQLVPARQEELLAYETGAKLSFLGRKLQTNFAAYYYDYSDKQLLTKTKDPIFGPVPILANAPKSQVYGAEIDVQAQPLVGLYLALAGSYVKTRIEEFISTNSQGNEQDFSGNPFNFSPETSFTAVADYTWPITDGLDLGVGGDFNYTGQTNASLDRLAVYYMQQSQVIGARVHVGANDKQWTLTAFARNLTDDYVPTGIYNVGDPVARFSAAPRTYGLTFNYLYD